VADHLTGRSITIPPQQRWMRAIRGRRSGSRRSGGRSAEPSS
jgi:hypothetical protein